MKVRTSVLRGFALLALSTLTFAACEDKTETPIVPTPVAVTVTPSQASLTVGQRTTFVAIVTGSTNQGVTWTSSTPAVATVNATTGEVTAVTPGTTVITATSAADATKRAAATVVVVPVPPSAITVRLVPDAATISTVTGSNQVQLTAVVTGTSNTGVTYTSLNSTVASVSAAGLVTGLTAGVAQIRARSVVDSLASNVSVITVTAAPPPTQVNIALSPTAATVATGDRQVFTAFVTGSTNTAVRFRSSDLTVATIDSVTGIATARSGGTTTITAIALADTTRRATGTLTVSPVVLSISPSSASIPVQGTQQFTTTASGSTNLAVKYRSSNVGVATVDSATGLARGVSAGNTTITAISMADTTRRSSAALTVTTVPVTIAVTPTTAGFNVGSQQAFTATVGGTTNTLVTCVSQNNSIVRVDSVTAAGVCRVTGMSAGTAVVRISSVADPNQFVDVTVTVAAVTAPSISIQSVTRQIVNAATGATETIVVTPGSQVAGTMNVVVNVSAGSATNISAVEIRLANAAGEVACAQQRFNPALAPTQGVATITLACNTAQLSTPGNTALFANGSYTLSAVALAGEGTAASPFSVVARATYGTVILNNTNVVTGTVSFFNGLIDNDNDADSEVEVSSNTGTTLLWNGGAITVALNTAVFSGNAITGISVTVDLNCNGTADAGEATRAVTVTNGAGSTTFPENTISTTVTSGVPNAGVDNVEDAAVCFFVGGATDAQGLPVTVPATGGAGNVFAAGFAAPAGGFNTQAGPAQNLFSIDNVEPNTPATGMSLDPADFDGLSTAAYIGLNRTFTATSGGTGNPTVLNVCGDGAGATVTCNASLAGVGLADGGVGEVTVTWYAVTSAEFAAATATGVTQGNMRAATTAANTRQFTTANQLLETTTSSSYQLVAEIKDGLGNRTYRSGVTFGVDITPPTIVLEDPAGGNSAPVAATNPPQTRYRYYVTDENSGAEGLRGTVQGQSVLILDTDLTEERRCYNLTGGLVATSGTPGVALAACTNQTQTTLVGTIGATTEVYDVLIPGTENFYTFAIQSFDAAGNFSTQVVTTTALIDRTAGPTGPAAAAGLTPVTVSQFTIVNPTATTAGSASVTGEVRDNIEIGFYDARFQFAGLTDRNGVNVPDELAFSARIPVGAYGLPLAPNASTGTVTVNTPVAVDAIHTTPSSGAFVANQFGFGMTDVAGNFAFGGANIPVGTTDGFAAALSFSRFDLAASNATIYRTNPTNNSANSQTTTLTATAEVIAGGANPFEGGQVFFYWVNPGGDNTYGTADDSNTLIAQFAAESATMLTGEFRRTFEWRTTLDAAALPLLPNGFPLRTFAVGVARDGDAVMTQVVNVTVNQQ